MPDQVRVQILFTKETKHGQFTDAIYMSPEEYADAKESDIEDAKQARADAYVAQVDQAKAQPPIEPTLEQLAADKAQVEKDLAYLNTKIVEKGGVLEAAVDEEVKP